MTASPSTTTTRMRAAVKDEIPVFVLTDDPKSMRAKLVCDVFDEELFSVHLTVVSIPRGRHNMTRKQAESYRLAFVLEQARKMNVNHVIVVKDTSVSVATPAVVADVVRSGIATHQDVLYLAYWNEHCGRFGDAIRIADSTVSLYRAIDPHGMQAIMFSARARDALLDSRALLADQRIEAGAKGRPHALRETLHHTIRKDGLLAAVVYPPVLVRDTSNGHFGKSHTCRVERGAPNEGGDDMDDDDAQVEGVAGAAADNTPYTPYAGETEVAATVPATARPSGTTPVVSFGTAASTAPKPQLASAPSVLIEEEDIFLVEPGKGQPAQHAGLTEAIQQQLLQQGCGYEGSVAQQKQNHAPRRKVSWFAILLVVILLILIGVLAYMYLRRRHAEKAALAEFAAPDVAEMRLQ